MTTLEKVLGTALIGVTALCTSVIVQTVKHIRKEQQLLDEIQDKCDEIVDVLEPEIEKAEKESV